MPIALTLVDALRDHILVMPNGCWHWTKLKAHNGYGRYSKHLAHRWVYEQMRGPIPDGLVLDHTCHNADESCTVGSKCLHRSCVNPDHLEPVTEEVNWERGRSPMPRHAAKTRCCNGHDFSPENTYRSKSRRGQARRTCRECNRQAVARYKARKEASR